MHDAMPDGGRRRHVGFGEQSADADDRFALVGNAMPFSESTGVAVRDPVAWNWPLLSPIASASPDSSISVRDASDAVQAEFER